MIREINGKWCIGIDDISFYDEYGSKEEAIQNGKDKYGTDFYIGEIIKINLEIKDISLEQKAIDLIEDLLYQECGEAAVNFNPSNAAHRDLELMLANSVLTWMKRYDLDKKVYGVGNIIKINGEDYGIY